MANNCTPSDFGQKLKLYKLDSDDLKMLLELYNKLLEFERQGKDHTWLSVLRNAFAPLLKGKFDFVVGNPPWVSWVNLPKQYREISKDLWEKYGLAKKKGRTGLVHINRVLARKLRKPAPAWVLNTVNVIMNPSLPPSLR